MRLRVIVAIAGIVVASAAVAQDKPLTAGDAKQHVGQTATVCGKVMSPRYASSSRGQPTFLNIDKEYPNQEFTVLIWGSDRAKFGSPEIDYKDKSICVTGKIQNYQGGVEIIANDPKQIQLKK
jgi:hypothetical protein